MKQTTLCFLIKNDRVLLGVKKRGFGVGKLNGVGGKRQEGETIELAAIREIKEEIGVTVASDELELVALLSFRFKDKEDWDQDCFVFAARRWEGEPVESEEIRPQWHATDAIPFEGMWVDDPHWLPHVLAGKKMKGEFLFSPDGAVLLEHRISEGLP